MLGVHVIFLAMHLCAGAHILHTHVPADILCTPSKVKIALLTKATVLHRYDG